MQWPVVVFACSQCADVRVAQCYEAVGDDPGRVSELEVVLQGASVTRLVAGE